MTHLNHYRKDLIHPHPKPIALYDKILEELQPKSVIDPFIGSGTTAEACVKLGIKWLGYEIEEKYSHDINLRLENCKKLKKKIQLQLECF